MNTHQAYQALGLSTDASDEEVQKAFKKKAAKLHPDVNKSNDAEQQFKHLNEAYQFIRNHTGKDNFTNYNNTDAAFWANIHSVAYSRMNDIFSNIYTKSGRTYINNNTTNKKQINSETTISFAESILGCQKQVTFNRRFKCKACDGKCYVQSVDTKKTCDKCNGKGRRIYQGNTVKELPCTTCNGTGHLRYRSACPKCGSIGSETKKHTTKVNIKPGTEDGQIVEILNEGDYIPGSIGMQRSAYIRINVKSQKNMKKIDSDIYSELDISLLDALKGVNIDVQTVKGQKTLKIKGPRKNGDQIKVAGFGVPPNGHQIFTLNVQYPENVQPIIDALENKEKG